MTLAPTRFAPALFLARSSLASYTWTECARMLEPVGVDLWSHELALKYGMRWVHLSCRRAMGNCLLVQESSLQHSNARFPHLAANCQ